MPAPASPDAILAHSVLGLTGQALAFLTLRLWLGARALVAGLEKYAAKVTVQEPLIDPVTGMPDPSGAMMDVEKKVYSLKHYNAIPDTLQTKFAAEPLLPEFLSKPFYAALGPALILLGLLLLLGVASRLTLFAMGLLYTSLTLGLMLIGQDGGVSWLAIHVVIVALALSLADHNRFALTRA